MAREGVGRCVRGRRGVSVSDELFYKTKRVVQINNSYWTIIVSSPDLRPERFCVGAEVGGGGQMGQGRAGGRSGGGGREGVGRRGKNGGKGTVGAEWGESRGQRGQRGAATAMDPRSSGAYAEGGTAGRKWWLWDNMCVGNDRKLWCCGRGREGVHPSGPSGSSPLIQSTVH